MKKFDDGDYRECETHEYSANDLASAFPTPWKIELRGSRAMILDAGGALIIAGMNVFKAHCIAAAVNRDAAQTAGEREVPVQHSSGLRPETEPAKR